MSTIRQADVKIFLTNDDEPLKYDRKDYLNFHEELSSKDRDIKVVFREQPVMDVVVPKGVFNPFGGIAAQAFVSGILSQLIDVKGKTVLDMGCGCGVIGLSCILQGSTKVVFSDLHPNVLPVKENSLFRAEDEVKVQDLCVEEKDSSFDTVFMSFPSRSNDAVMEDDSFEIGILRNDTLVFKGIEQVARVLVANGTFVFFYRVFNNSFPLYLEVMAKLAAHFDLSTLKLLWYSGESDGHGLLLSVRSKGSFDSASSDDSSNSTPVSFIEHTK